MDKRKQQQNDTFIEREHSLYNAKKKIIFYEKLFPYCS